MNIDDVGYDQSTGHQIGWKAWRGFWYPLMPRRSLSVRVAEAFSLFQEAHCPAQGEKFNWWGTLEI